jgi:hypothetical protein
MRCSGIALSSVASFAGSLIVETLIGVATTPGPTPPPKPRHRLVYQHLQIGQSADIGFDPDRLVAEFGDLALERLGRFRMRHIIDDDIGIEARQFEHGRLADTGIAAGEDRDFAL